MMRTFATESNEGLSEGDEKRFDNEIGEEYDLFRLASPYHDEIQAGVSEELDPEATKVVEIGFGTGITSGLLLEKNEKIHLWAVDNEPKMLGKASKALERFGADRFDLVIEDAVVFLRQIPDSSIDAVASVFVIHNMPQEYKTELLAEIYRILKPGGVFIDGDKIADSDPGKHQAHLAWQLEKFDVFEEMGRGELKEEWTAHYHEDEGEDRIMVEDKFLENLGEIGFVSAELKQRWQMDALVVARK